MIDVLLHLGQGFLTVFQPVNFVVLCIGLVLGLLVAVLPGLTLVMGVVLVLPFTYKLGITPAVILLTAMYVTGTYGGAFTAILFRIPGEPIDVPLLWDGYVMAKNGEPAKALGWTLFAALAGGLVAAVVMVALSEPVARLALTFSTSGIFRARPVRPRQRRLPRRRLADQCLRVAAHRPAHRHRRRRRHLRHGPLLVRLRHAARRHRVSRRHGGCLRAGRSAVAARKGLHLADRAAARQDRDQAAVGGRDRTTERHVRTLVPARHRRRHRAGRRRNDRVVPVLWRRGAVRQAAQGDGHRHTPRASWRRRPPRPHPSAAP